MVIYLLRICSGILTGIASNMISKRILADGSSGRNTTEALPDIPNESETSTSAVPLYRTFSLVYDFEKILDKTPRPHACFGIENRPSGWNCVSIIIESQQSVEWYAFWSGYTAFEGCGGGISNAQMAISEFKRRNIGFSFLVFPQSTIRGLDNGLVNWHRVKTNGIPLDAYLSEERNWKYIKENINSLIN